MFINKKTVFVVFLIGVVFSGALIVPELIGNKDWRFTTSDFGIKRPSTLRIDELAAVIYSLNISSEKMPVGTSIFVSAKYLLEYSNPGDGYATLSLKNEKGDIIQTKTNFTKGLVIWNTTIFLDPLSWSPKQEGENATIELEVCASDSTGEQIEHKTVSFLVIRSNITIIKGTQEGNITYGITRIFKYTFLNAQNNSITITNHTFNWRIVDTKNITRLEDSNMTDSTGSGNISVDTTILGVGNYKIWIYVNQSDDYNYAEYTQRINILNQSTYLDCYILNHEIFTSVNYTSRNATIQIEIMYYGEDNITLNNFIVNWISQFNSGVIYNMNSTTILNITAPQSPGTYNLTITTIKDNYQDATEVISLNVLPRELNTSIDKGYISIGENLINISTFDIISNCSITGISLLFYYEMTIENSDFKKFGVLNTSISYLNLTFKIPLKYSVYKKGTLKIIYNETYNNMSIFVPYSFSFQLTINTSKIDRITIINGTVCNITRGRVILFLLNLSSLEGGINENISVDIKYLNTTIYQEIIYNYSSVKEIGSLNSDTFNIGPCYVSIELLAENTLIKHINFLLNVFSQTGLEVYVMISDS